MLYTERKAKDGIVIGATRLIGHAPPHIGDWPNSTPAHYWTLSPWQRVKPGDRLWVRENLRLLEGGFVQYVADHKGFQFGSLPFEIWKKANFKKHRAGRIVPSIYMPRWASRLTLVVTATKIEPLQSISEVDAACEGMWPDEIVVGGKTRVGWFIGAKGDACSETPIRAFECLWVQLHGPESWRQNPEVVAMSFEVHKQNIDSMKEAA